MKSKGCPICGKQHELSECVSLLSLVYHSPSGGRTLCDVLSKALREGNAEIALKAVSGSVADLLAPLFRGNPPDMAAVRLTEVEY